MNQTIKHDQKIIEIYDCGTNDQQCSRFKESVDQLESSQQSYLIILIIAIVLSLITLLLSFTNLVYKFKNNQKQNNQEQNQSKQKQMQRYYLKLFIYCYRACKVLNIIFIQIGFIGIIVSNNNFEIKIQSMETYNQQQRQRSLNYIKNFQNNLKPFYALQAFLIIALVTDLLIYFCSKQKDKILKSKKYQSKHQLNQSLQKLQCNNQSHKKINKINLKCQTKQKVEQKFLVQSIHLENGKQNPYTSQEFKINKIQSQRNTLSYNQQKNKLNSQNILTPVSLKQKIQTFKNQQKQQSKNAINSSMLYAILKKQKRNTKQNHD